MKPKKKSSGIYFCLISEQIIYITLYKDFGHFATNGTWIDVRFSQPDYTNLVYIGKV